MRCGSCSEELQQAPSGMRFCDANDCLQDEVASSKRDGYVHLSSASCHSVVDVIEVYYISKTSRTPVCDDIECRVFEVRMMTSVLENGCIQVKLLREVLSVEEK